MANELTPKDVFEGDSAIQRIVDELDGMYPQFTPSPKDDLTRIMYRSGQRSVIEYLIAKLNNV
jgi:hypothetical protein